MPDKQDIVIRLAALVHNFHHIKHVPGTCAYLKHSIPLEMNSKAGWKTILQAGNANLHSSARNSPLKTVFAVKTS
jgi:hypothetical protein